MTERLSLSEPAMASGADLRRAGVPANERLEPVVDPQERYPSGCGGWWTTAWHRWVSWWWRGSTIYDTALPDGYALQRTELWKARWGVNTRPEER
jgi:hypothetical protein